MSRTCGRDDGESEKLQCQPSCIFTDLDETPSRRWNDPVVDLAEAWRCPSYTTKPSYWPTLAEMSKTSSRPSHDCKHYGQSLASIVSNGSFSRSSFRSRTGGVAPVWMASERDPRSASRSRCSLCDDQGVGIHSWQRREVEQT